MDETFNEQQQKGDVKCYFLRRASTISQRVRHWEPIKRTNATATITQVDDIFNDISVVVYIGLITRV